MNQITKLESKIKEIDERMLPYDTTQLLVKQHNEKIVAQERHSYDIGDVSGDGKIDPIDLAYLIEYNIGARFFTDNQRYAGDLDANNKVDDKDVTIMKMIVYKIIKVEQLPYKGSLKEF